MTIYSELTWSIDGNLFLVALAATGCLCWTIWLILLTIAPNVTINWLMATEAFDEGSYWRFIDPQPSALFLGIGGLSCIALAYLYIIVRVLTTIPLSIRKNLQSKRRSTRKINVAAAPTNTREVRLTSTDHVIWTAVTKFPKLVSHYKVVRVSTVCSYI